MKKFFSEFKKFITRGNVIDMAVGVIVGGAFTAIVTALTTQIFNPLINWLLSVLVGEGGGLESAVTMLKPVYEEGTNVIDMAKSIYINWGAVISAIINFLLIAFILFTIVKAINSLREATAPKYCGYSKEEFRNLVKAGKTREQIEKMAAERDAAAAEAKKAADEEAKLHTTEGLLEQIKNLLEQQAKNDGSDK